MKVQVLGTGCAKCRALVERVQAAAGAAGVACDVEKVEDVAHRDVEAGAPLAWAIAPSIQRTGARRSCTSAVAARAPAGRKPRSLVSAMRFFRWVAVTIRLSRAWLSW